MNNPSPLIPQGSMLEQKNKGRARVKIAVFFVLAIHGIGLLALLLQGCQRDQGNATADNAAGSTNAAQIPFEPTNPPVAETSNTAYSASNTLVPATATTNNGLVGTVAPTAPPEASAMGDYEVAKGDTLSGIATKFHVTVKALEDANPGVEPTKLKLKQKLHIPAPTVGSAGSTRAADASSAGGSSGSSNIYKVKSGDTLTSIAHHFGVTVKQIRSANNLKTDSIKVGQALTIPAKAGGAGPDSGAATSPTTAQ